MKEGSKGGRGEVDTNCLKEGSKEREGVRLTLLLGEEGRKEGSEVDTTA